MIAGTAITAAVLAAAAALYAKFGRRQPQPVPVRVRSRSR